MRSPNEIESNKKSPHKFKPKTSQSSLLITVPLKPKKVIKDYLDHLDCIQIKTSTIIR